MQLLQEPIYNMAPGDNHEFFIPLIRNIHIIVKSG